MGLTDLLEKAAEDFGKIQDRWKEIPNKTKNRLYDIANAPSSKNIQPWIDETLREIRGQITIPYNENTTRAVEIELIAAIEAYRSQNPAKYGPFNDQNTQAVAA